MLGRVKLYPTTSLTLVCTTKNHALSHATINLSEFVATKEKRGENDKQTTVTPNMPTSYVGVQKL